MNQRSQERAVPPEWSLRASSPCDRTIWRVSLMRSIGSNKSSPKNECSLPDQTLPRALRFKDSAHFNHAKRRGVRIHTPHFIAYVVNNSDSPTRLGVTVSKKVGRAHHRAYMKRLMREAFRRSELRQSTGFDVSLIAKKDLPKPALSALIIELNRLGDQALSRMNQPRRDRPQKRGSKRSQKSKDQKSRSQPVSSQKLTRSHDPETPQSS